MSNLYQTYISPMDLPFILRFSSVHSRFLADFRLCDSKPLPTLRLRQAGLPAGAQVIALAGRPTSLIVTACRHGPFGGDRRSPHRISCDGMTNLSNRWPISQPGLKGLMIFRDWTLPVRRGMFAMVINGFREGSSVAPYYFKQ